jgi:stearoyl-CoA desaturase (Delta-9 desaturase)
MAILLFLVIHWYVSLFFQSFFHHRYAAHKMFTMSAFWEKVFYCCCFITQGSSYISPYAYGIMHRQHHAFADTANDPHSPYNSGNFFSMLWQTRNNYFGIFSGRVPVDEHFKKGVPNWQVFDKLVHNWPMRLICAIIYVLVYFFLATSWWMYLFLPVTIAMATLQGAVVNWWAHRFGYRNFEMQNDSKNIVPVDLFFWGEAYHNNHHSHPARANTSFRWFELDAGYLVIRLLHSLNIIQLKRQPH